MPFIRRSKDLTSELLAKSQSFGGGRRLYLGGLMGSNSYRWAWETQLPTLQGVKEATLEDFKLQQKDLMELIGKLPPQTCTLRRSDPSRFLADLEALHFRHCEFGTNKDNYDDEDDDGAMRTLGPASLAVNPVFSNLHTLSLLDVQLFTIDFPSWPNGTLHPVFLVSITSPTSWTATTTMRTRPATPRGFDVSLGQLGHSSSRSPSLGARRTTKSTSLEAPFRPSSTSRCTLITISRALSARAGILTSLSPTLQIGHLNAADL